MLKVSGSTKTNFFNESEEHREKIERNGQLNYGNSLLDKLAKCRRKIGEIDAEDKCPAERGKRGVGELERSRALAWRRERLEAKCAALERSIMQIADRYPDCVHRERECNEVSDRGFDWKSLFGGLRRIGLLALMGSPAAAAQTKADCVMLVHGENSVTLPNGQSSALLVKALQPHCEVLRTEAVFPTNFVNLGKNGAVVSGKIKLPPGVKAPADIENGMKYHSAQVDHVLDSLTRYGIPHQSLEFPSNMAHVQYDEQLDLLIIDHSKFAGAGQDRGTLTFHPYFRDKVSNVITAFGKPSNIIELFSNEIKGSKALNKCYDLDLFFHMTTTKDGKKIAMVYWDCIKESAPGYMGMGRQAVKNKLKDLGITVIDLDESDYLSLAGNALSLGPGKTMFATEPSDGLKRRLIDAGLDAEGIITPGNGAIFGDPEDFGPHCVATKVRRPQPFADVPRPRTEL